MLATAEPGERRRGAHIAPAVHVGCGSSLTDRIDRLQFLTGEVALLTAYGDIDVGVDRPSERRRTIETLTAQQVGGRWALATRQRTPRGRWPVPGPGRAVPADKPEPPEQTLMAPTTATDDEAEIRSLYRKMLDCWLTLRALCQPWLARLVNLLLTSSGLRNETFRSATMPGLIASSGGRTSRSTSSTTRRPSASPTTRWTSSPKAGGDFIRDSTRGAVTRANIG